MEVYDNGGATFDRFTVVTENGDIFMMSENALSPSGVNQHGGTLPRGEKYKPNPTIKETGVKLQDVPPAVLVATIQRLEAQLAEATRLPRRKIRVI